MIEPFRVPHSTRLKEVLPKQPNSIRPAQHRQILRRRCRPSSRNPDRSEAGLALQPYPDRPTLCVPLANTVSRNARDRMGSRRTPLLNPNRR
jgi:hypothetical protein